MNNFAPILGSFNYISISWTKHIKICFHRIDHSVPDENNQDDQEPVVVQVADVLKIILDARKL